MPGSLPCSTLTSFIIFHLPTGTKIFNWLSTYLGNPPLLQLKTSSAFFGLLFLLMFTIGGSTGIILGNAAVDLGLHDTYYVVAHFHFVLSLGAVIAIFSGIMFNGEKIVGSKNYLPSTSCTLSLYTGVPWVSLFHLSGFCLHQSFSFTGLSSSHSLGTGLSFISQDYTVVSWNSFIFFLIFLSLFLL